jgi:uncharacterized repeat protein (TIGR02543 family)
MPSNPTKSGYTFGGWYTEVNGGGAEFTGSTTVTADITVYAKWTAVSASQYTVTFNADGGSPATQTRTVNSGNSLGASNMPSNPTKSGYTFDGWYTAINGGGTQFTATTAVTGDITVYAKWTAVSASQYTVTFNADGGTPATQTRTVNSGASTGSSNMPAEPDKSGYTFDGWYTEVNGGGTQFTAETAVTGNITVYAKWTAVSASQYTVTFNADGGSPATQTRTVTSGDSTGSSNMPAEPGRSGYTFDGWYTEVNGGGTQFTDATMVTANITVYAKWTAIQYTVTFNADGGSPATQTRTVTSGASTGSSNMPAEPDRSGYAFGGWYTEVNGGGAEFTAATAVTGDITVYAKWSPDSFGVITLDLDAGSGAFDTTDFIISKSNGAGSQTLILSGSDYTNPQWFVDGELKGTGNNIIINAVDYRVGGHTLSLIVSKNGVFWSKEIGFTVNN